MPLHHTTTPAHREPGSPEPVEREESSGFVSEPGFFNHPELPCEPDHPSGGVLSVSYTHLTLPTILLV